MSFCHNVNLDPKLPSKMVHETSKISSGGDVNKEDTNFNSYIYYV